MQEEPEIVQEKDFLGVFAARKSDAVKAVRENQAEQLDQGGIRAVSHRSGILSVGGKLMNNGRKL